MAPTRAEAQNRVREFLRQWNLPHSHKTNEVYGIFIDPEAEMSNLLASDIAVLLEDPPGRTQYGLRRLDRPEEVVALEILDREDIISPRKGWELVERQVSDWKPTTSTPSPRST